ncbi:SDR family oxidoreductase [Acinetobacter sp. DSM 11652]|uniref:SDR family oxidoreductase n=1 Tax=Acinetobacter sp. DSM 11652 TaxID=346222 RepID=UPI0008C600CA|nr:SDR family oxidoreductase [Acinetobacter sp. DSM 11652]SEL47163.1 NAD(P)H dehydrogenase (quinone) [Acinetobacter sp. DSM 11652]
MILVTGATGQLGRSVVQQLKQQLQNNEFAVLARNLEKAKPYVNEHIEVREGDFNQPESLVKAFQDVDKLLLISTMEMNRFEQHKNVIDAAREAGVQHVYYTGLSIQNIENSAVKDLMISHFQTEDYLKASGLKYTLLRNTMYAEAIPQIIGERVIDTGIQLSGGAGKVPYVLRAELGEAIANALIQNDHENKVYELVGSQTYSYQNIADELSQLKTIPVEYHDLTEEAYQQFLKRIGLPEFLIYLTHGTVVDIKHRQYEVQSQDLEQLLGRPSQSLKSMLASLYA